MSRAELTLYFRYGCSLCEEMQRALGPLQRELGFRLAAVDIESDPALEGRYGEWVPVLAAGEEELCHYFLDPQTVRRYFAAS